MKMNICFVSSMHDWNDDRIFERAAVGLASRGHEVTYISPGEKEHQVEGVKLLNIPIRSRLLKHLISPVEAYIKMTKCKADIYHFYNPNLMVLMLFWSLRGKNVFIDVHENYEARIDAFPLPNAIRKYFVKIYRFCENKLCSSYNGITVVTNTMKRKMESSNTPILVVDNVPYLERLSEVRLSDHKAVEPTIITSGTHSDARNCMKAVEALPYILAKIPNARMKFVGRFSPENYEYELLDKAKNLGVSEHLETEGMLPWLENFERISSAHVGCVFYNDNLNNRVTLPNRLYEYLYCGLVVLGENFPEVKKVLQESDAGVVIDSQNPKDIAEKAISLLSNLDLLKDKSKKAQHAVSTKYNFENALENLILFYEQNAK